MKLDKRIYGWLILLGFLLTYLLLPSNNNSIDSWCFAGYVKQNENLFLPHHLLYNALGFVWVKALGFLGIDTLKLLIVLNSLFAVATLYILKLILSLLGLTDKRILVWIAFAGSSWAIMRYATENETYIVPLFFSLLGSFFFIKYLKQENRKYIFLSGFFAAIACLFHQVMFFWWLSLLVGVIFKKDIKSFLIFAFTAFIVPASYLLVISIYYNLPLTLASILHFTFSDYYSGAAEISLGINCFILTVISIIRSFFQVHGYIANLPKINAFYIISCLIALSLFVLGFIRINRVKWSLNKLNETSVWVHSLAILLQLIFAFLSNGNAEFIVMIPILLIIVLSQIIQNEVRIIGFIALSLFVWNVSVGLIPLNTNSLDSNRTISEYILQDKNSSKCLFILFNKPCVENRVKYFSGKYPKNVMSGTQYKNIEVLKTRILSAIEKDTVVLTDIYKRPKTISRENLLLGRNIETLFDGFSIQKRDSVKTLTGKYFISEIR